MELMHFSEGARTNFGDDLNIWLWKELLPRLWEQDGVRFSGIGTILNQELMPPGHKWIVLGSGIGYGRPPVDFGSDSWQVLAVRGPLTARALKIDRSFAVTDGAILLSALPQCKPLPESERSGIVFMPHYQSMPAGNWEEVCRVAGFEFIDPCGSSKAIVERIRRAKFVLADAMHAAIVADTLRVPWIPLITSSTINTLKWLDWTESMGTQYEPTYLRPSSSMEAWRNRTNFLFAERFCLPEKTVESAMKDYEFKCNLLEKPWWPVWRKLSRGFLYRVPLDVYRSKLMQGARRSDLRAHIETSAESLRRAATLRPYLSSDETFNRRKAQMLEAVSRVPACIQLLSSFGR